MIKRISLILLIFVFFSNCSFDTKSGIWTNNEKITRNDQIKILFKKNKAISKEFNQNFLIKTPLKINKKNNSLISNNFGPQIIKDSFDAKSKYNFSKIKYFENFNPELVFDKENLIFFDKNGSVIKFNDTSKILWKKNYYTKKEKKLLPILNFSLNKDALIVTDNLAKFYALNLKSGEILWTKIHTSVVISEIKIDKDKFYVVDSENDINCFSLIDGKKIWTFKSDYDLIKSQKKLSIVYDDSKVYFNNSKGDIYALDKINGNLVWLTPTRTGTESLKSFLIKSSKLVLDQGNLFFSNNNNTFFSLDSNTGFINWIQNINSEFKPIIFENIIFSISSDGYLFLIDKTNGNIIRVTDIFTNFSPKKIKEMSITGFVVGLNKIYLSLNNGKILEINISNGKLANILKISRGKISSPFINSGKMFIVKNDGIIKLN
ncbi:PQQ-binding-like beta-propeller repeat protein [bacterium]|nr:PQQ-binding-like beta-propeller repeat protein [bacterium]